MWIDISLNLLSRIIGSWSFLYVQLFDANSEFCNIAAFPMQFMLYAVYLYSLTLVGL
jgi:hypothetical protein